MMSQPTCRVRRTFGLSTPEPSSKLHGTANGTRSACVRVPIRVWLQVLEREVQNHVGGDSRHPVDPLGLRAGEVVAAARDGNCVTLLVVRR